MADLSELYDAILTGNAPKAEEVTKAALEANIDPTEKVSSPVSTSTLNMRAPSKWIFNPFSRQ